MTETKNAPVVSNRTRKAVSSDSKKSKLRRSVRSILGGREANPEEVTKVTNAVWLKHQARKGASAADITMKAILAVIEQEEEKGRVRRQRRRTPRRSDVLVDRFDLQ